MPVPARFEVRRFEELDSTNRYLLDEARAGAPDGVVAVADHQSAGRGRMGRAWSAPPGASLLVSVLLRPGLPAARAHLVTLAAGLAMADAVFQAAGFMPSLKWPNDLVVGPRKLAGMLSEADVADGGLQALVVGIGVNVNWDEFPEELAATAVACNQVAGRPVERDEVLAHFLDRFDARLPVDAAAVLGEYRLRCSTLGRRVRVEQAGGVLEGVATDVDDDGHLVVALDSGEVVDVAVGDVVHLRPV